MCSSKTLSVNVWGLSLSHHDFFHFLCWIIRKNCIFYLYPNMRTDLTHFDYFLEKADQLFFSNCKNYSQLNLWAYLDKVFRLICCSVFLGLHDAYFGGLFFCWMLFKESRSKWNQFYFVCLLCFFTGLNFRHFKAFFLFSSKRSCVFYLI